MSVPLVSVLLPVYNGEPYLAAALESVLRQDYKRLEVIAIDDGSTDRRCTSCDAIRRPMAGSVSSRARTAGLLRPSTKA